MSCRYKENYRNVTKALEWHVPPANSESEGGWPRPGTARFPDRDGSPLALSPRGPPVCAIRGGDSKSRRQTPRRRGAAGDAGPRALPRGWRRAAPRAGEVQLLSYAVRCKFCGSLEKLLVWHGPQRPATRQQQQRRGLKGRSRPPRPEHPCPARRAFVGPQCDPAGRGETAPGRRPEDPESPASYLFQPWRKGGRGSRLLPPLEMEGVGLFAKTMWLGVAGRSYSGTSFTLR